MTGSIYLVQQDGNLVEMPEQGCKSEDLLQALLARYPAILAGDQMDSDAPRRWLLISREIPIPGDQLGVGRWALDHLFVDQDGVPTLVEVKRSSDTRIRREVVGQMLDYAANGIKYWPPETIRAHFESACGADGRDPAEVLRDALGPDTDPETFWQLVKTNLQAGHVRLVFVADLIPPELRRIVEFLNGQMDPAEVLAVEVKQYSAQGLQTLVPRVYGATAEAERKKGPVPPARQWDERSFFEQLSARSPVEARTATRILEWAKPRVTQVWWGRGAQYGSFVPVVNHKGRDHQLLAVYTSGIVYIYFHVYRNKPPFNDDVNRRELLRKFQALPGVSFTDDSLNRQPPLPLALLEHDATLEEFLRIFEWMLDEIKRS